MSLVGKTVAHFTIVGELGKGGMGIIYDAQDSRLPRRVALKFLPENVVFDDTTLARFRREAESLSRLNHPHICTIYETGTYHRRPFIAMERLEGETLRARLDRGTLTFPEILDFGLQLADALGAAHAQRIVHRDVKPGNVFITTRGVAKLLDFGLAKETFSDLDDGRGRASLTATGRPLGTPGCMSPEQICQRPVDGRSDLFSLGSLLYLMTCGKPPFQGESIIETIHNVIYEDPQPLSSLRPDTPPPLADVILKLLRKSPADRYASADELMKALREVRVHVPAAPSPERTLIRRRTGGSGVDGRVLPAEQPVQQPAQGFTPRHAPSAGGGSAEQKSAPLTGIVDHQTRLGLCGIARPGDVWPEVASRARAELATDPDVAAAHTSLGIALSQYEWDFPAAEQEFRQAIRLHPGDARAYYFYGLQLMSMDQLNAAGRAMTAAIGLDPMSKPAISTLAYIHYYAGDFDAALRECRRAIALDPRYFEAFGCLGLTEVARGNLAAGLDAFRRADGLTRGLFTRARAFLAHALGCSGHTIDARAVLDGLQVESQKRYVPSAHLAIAAIGLGEFERAFAALEDAFTTRDGTLLLLQLLPVFAPLHRDGRFGQLCRRVGLPVLEGTGSAQAGAADASGQNSSRIGVLGSTRLPPAPR